MSPRPETLRWPGWLIVLHWSIALALLVLIGAGMMMVAAEEHAAATGDYSVTVLGVPLYQAYQLHKSFGITLFALILLRLVLRAALRAKAPDQGHSALERLAARTVQVALYALMLSLPITGWLMASASPLGLPTIWFGLVSIPHPLGPDAALEALFANLHALCGKALLALGALHAAAAVKHHLLDRDGTLVAMLPLLKTLEK